jgi:hypothetical protein
VAGGLPAEHVRPLADDFGEGAVTGPEPDSGDFVGQSEFFGCGALGGHSTLSVVLSGCANTITLDFEGNGHRMQA